MGFCVAKGILIFRITDPTLSTHKMRLRKVVQLVLIILMIGGYGASIIKSNRAWEKHDNTRTKNIPHSSDGYHTNCNLICMQGEMTL